MPARAEQITSAVFTAARPAEIRSRQARPAETPAGTAATAESRHEAARWAREVEASMKPARLSDD